MAGNIINVAVLLDSKQFKKGMDSISSDTDRLAKGFAEFAKKAAAAFAVAAAAIGAVVVNSVKGASELEQSIGAIDAVFKGNAAEMHAWSKAAAQAAGLSRNEYNEMATVIGSLFKNMGVPMDQLNAKTNETITLGADLSAMYGGTATEAVEALSSAYKGQFDPLEQYGISLNASAVAAEATALGYKKVDGQLSATAKQHATMSLITKQSTDAQGKFAEESETLAGQQQRLNAELQNASDTLGTTFLPILTDVTTELNTQMAPAMEGLKGFLENDLKPALEDFGNYVKDTLLPNLEGFGEWLQKAAPYIGAVTIFVGILTVALFAKAAALAVASGALGVWTSITNLASAAQRLFNASLLANPIVLVVVAIVALIAALVWFFTQTETGRKAWDTFTKFLTSSWDGFTKFIKKAWENIVKFFDDARVKISEVMSAIGKWISDKWDEVKKAGERVGEFFTKDIPAFFGRAKDAIVERFAAVKDGILKPIKSALDWINDNFVNKINGFLGTIGISWRLPPLSIPGYAEGGYTGPGARLQPAGIVHAGEVVWSQADVAAWGGPHIVDAMRKRKRLPGYAGGGIVANARQGFGGYDPKALAAMMAWAAATGRKWYMTGAGGSRSFAEQARLYAAYLAGHGNLAANPHTGRKGPHMAPAIAMDLSPRPGEVAAARALMGRFGLGLPVRGEPWHLQYLAGRSGGQTAGGDDGGGAFNISAMLSGLIDALPSFTKPWGDIVKEVLKKGVEGIGAKIFDGGGWWAPGTLGFNAGSSPEAVLTPTQSKALIKMAEGGSGNTYIFNGIEVKSRRMEDLLDELALEVEHYAGVGV